MRKSYWKECCLILIGLILGCLYQKHLGSLPIIKETIIRDTTIVKCDTVYASRIPNKTSVLAELKKQNVPHSKIVAAQAIHETANFKSRLCKTHNNIFGIKKNDKEYKKYDNYIACISDYKKRISSKYKGGDYYNFLVNMRYAEDPEYVQKLKRIVNRI